MLLRWILNVIAILIVSQITPGFEVASVWWAILTLIVLSLVNAIIRPLVILLTLPINIVTLGLFTLVINGFMLWIVGSILKGVSIGGLGDAITAAFLLWLFSLITNLISQPGDPVIRNAKSVKE